MTGISTSLNSGGGYQIGGTLSTPKNLIFAGNFDTNPFTFYNATQVNGRVSDIASLTSTPGTSVADMFTMAGNNNLGQVIYGNNNSGFGITQSCLSIANHVNADTVNANSFIVISTAVHVSSIQALQYTPLTLSFWVYTGVTGTYSVHILINTYAGNPYQICVPYTIAAINTWQQVIITLPACGFALGSNDAKSAALGLQIDWCLMSGTDYTGSEISTWTEVTGSYQQFGVTGQVNQLASTSYGFFQLAQVQLEWGDTATQFEILPAELVAKMCEQYIESNYSLASTFFGNPNIVPTSTSFPTRQVGSTLGGGVVNYKSNKITGTYSTPNILTYNSNNGTAGNVESTSTTGTTSSRTATITGSYSGCFTFTYPVTNQYATCFYIVDYFSNNLTYTVA